MPLDRDMETGAISALVGEEGNIAGQPGGGPLAPLRDIPFDNVKRFRAFSSTAASAGGDATITFAGPNLGFCWLVERIAVRGGGTATVYVKSVDDAGFVDFTPAGTADVADENQPIYVPGGDALIVVFAGAGAGTNCRVGIQSRIQKEG